MAAEIGVVRAKLGYVVAHPDTEHPGREDPFHTVFKKEIDLSSINTTKADLTKGEKRK